MDDQERGFECNYSIGELYDMFDRIPLGLWVYILLFFFPLSLSKGFGFISFFSLLSSLFSFLPFISITVFFYVKVLKGYRYPKRHNK